MADYIPPEYQSEIAKINRQRSMAQALLQNSFSPKETEVVSGRAVPQGGLQAIAKLLTGGISNYNLGALDDEASGLQGKISQYRAGQLRNVLANPESGLVNPDPQAQALAAAIIGRRDKRMEGFAGAIKERDPQAAARVFQAGELPTEDYQVPAIPPPTFGVDEGGNRYSLTPNVKGDSDLAYAPKPLTITNNQPAQRSTAYDTIKPEVDKRQEAATFAKETLQANRTAIEALNEGAKTGAGGEFFQAVRKIGAALNFDIEGKVPTEKLSMALGNHILANARKFAPVTNEDIKRLEKILGSLNTEPQNLMQMFEVMNAASIKTLQDYNAYIDTTASGFQDEYKGILQARKQGFDVMAPGGNPTQQMRTMQEFVRQGGDPTQFLAPAEIDPKTGQALPRQPFPAGAKFDIRGTGLPKPAVPSKKIADMKPDAKAAEIKALRLQLRLDEKPTP